MAALKPQSTLPFPRLPHSSYKLRSEVNAPYDLQTDLPVTSQDKPTLLSSKDESYFVDGLKEWQKQALQEFKLRIAAAIKTNVFTPSSSEAHAPRNVDLQVVKMVGTVGSQGSEEEVAKKAQEDPVVDDEVKDAMVMNLQENMVAGSAAPDSEVVGQSALLLEKGKENYKVPLPNLDPPPSFVTKSEEVLVGGDSCAEDICLWGVPLLYTKKDERTDVVLVKFLRARDFRVTDAFNMLKNTILWRKRFGVDKILERDFGSSLDGVGYMHGCAKQGHPVCYNVYGVFQDADLYEQTFGDVYRVRRFMEWRIQLMEKGIQQLNFRPGGTNAMVQIIDLKNAPGPGRKEMRTAFKLAGALLEDNYPELVAKKVFVNVPWYFSAIYSVFSPFLTQRTKGKLVVARSGRVTEALVKLISPEYVPVQYGGLSRPHDSDFNGVECRCTIIKAGEAIAIAIPVDEAESTVVWDLVVVGWNVGYCVAYERPLIQMIIERWSKIASLESPIRNSYKASQVGKLVLSINNAASRKNKIVAYRYVVKPNSK